VLARFYGLAWQSVDDEGVARFTEQMFEREQELLLRRRGLGGSRGRLLAGSLLGDRIFARSGRSQQNHSLAATLGHPAGSNQAQARAAGGFGIEPAGLAIGVSDQNAARQSFQDAAQKSAHPRCLLQTA
jgi:hypothetical protein